MTPRVSDFAKALCAAVLLLAAPASAKQKETVLHSFATQGGDGLQPLAGLIADAAGNLYGTTFGGGEGQNGTVFVITPDGVETVLHSFEGGLTDGGFPAAALTLDRKGNLYGTTILGGASNQGVVFQLKPHNGAWKETILYSFCPQANCADGATPDGPVTVGPGGILFGTTATGGTGAVTPNSGVVYRLDPPAKHSAWTETVLHNFCDQGGCADGKNPLAPRLLLTKSGTLYGTSSKNTGDGGTLYSLSTDGGNFQVLHQFGDRPGFFPDAGVVSDKEGVLYGTLRSSGIACGGVYSFDTGTSAYSIVDEFCSGAQNGPKVGSGELALKENKKGVTLYGMSQSGGQNGGGTLYALTPPVTKGDPWNEQVLYDFCAKAACADGGTPFDAAVLDIDGVLYGTTSAGGAQNAGVVFRIGKN